MRREAAFPFRPRVREHPDPITHNPNFFFPKNSQQKQAVPAPAPFSVIILIAPLR
jgi:hypothetical protein